MCRLTLIILKTTFRTPRKVVVLPAICYRIILMAAPGESFVDTLTPSDPLTGYDPAKGVAIRNSTNSVLTDGFSIRDNCVDLIGLQIKSDHGNGVGGGQTHSGNDVTVRHSIVEGGAISDAGTAAINLDTQMLVENSLVVAHGIFGIREDYPGTILHSTLINPDRVPNSIAIEVVLGWVFTGETVSNTAIFGFAHVAGSTSNPEATDWTGMRWFGTHNITDAPVGDHGSLSLGREGTATVRILPGQFMAVLLRLPSGPFPAIIGCRRPRHSLAPAARTAPSVPRAARRTEVARRCIPSTRLTSSARRVRRPAATTSGPGRSRCRTGSLRASTAACDNDPGPPGRQSAQPQ